MFMRDPDDGAAGAAATAAWCGPASRCATVLTIVLGPVPERRCSTIVGTRPRPVGAGRRLAGVARVGRPTVRPVRRGRRSPPGERERRPARSRTPPPASSRGRPDGESVDRPGEPDGEPAPAAPATATHRRRRDGRGRGPTATAADGRRTARRRGRRRGRRRAAAGVERQQHDADEEAAPATTPVTRPSAIAVFPPIGPSVPVRTGQGRFAPPSTTIRPPCDRIAPPRRLPASCPRC